MLARFFFTGHSIYEFTALTKITVEDEGPSWFSGSGLVVVFRPNFSSSSSFHLTVFSIFLLSPLIPDICHFWYATKFDLGKKYTSYLTALIFSSRCRWSPTACPITPSPSSISPLSFESFATAASVHLKQYR